VRHILSSATAVGSSTFSPFPSLLSDVSTPSPLEGHYLAVTPVNDYARHDFYHFSPDPVVWLGFSPARATPPGKSSPHLRHQRGQRWMARKQGSPLTRGHSLTPTLAHRQFPFSRFGKEPHSAQRLADALKAPNGLCPSPGISAPLRASHALQSRTIPALRSYASATGTVWIKKTLTVLDVTEPVNRGDHERSKVMWTM
jgi:hypothetical protein